MVRQNNLSQVQLIVYDTESIRADPAEGCVDNRVIYEQFFKAVGKTALQAVKRYETVMPLSGFKITVRQNISGIPVALHHQVQVNQTGKAQIVQRAHALQLASFSVNMVCTGIDIIIAPGFQCSAVDFCVHVGKTEQAIGIVHVSDHIRKVQGRNMQFFHFYSAPATGADSRPFHFGHYRHMVMDIHAKAQ